jgi:hypothetical protein
MLAMLRVRYRRRCPVASWVDLERLCGIGEAGLHVVMGCRQYRAMHGAATWSHGAMPAAWSPACMDTC